MLIIIKHYNRYLKTEPKTYEFKDHFTRGKKRVYGFIAQQIAEVIPEAEAIQKGLYDIYNDFRCNDSIIQITITDYEGVYNIGDRLNCMFKVG
jgi:hypothetical protein